MLRRNVLLSIILVGGVFVSYSAASAGGGDEIPAEVLNQPGQGDASDPREVRITGVTPEHAAYLFAKEIEQTLELAAEADTEGDAESRDAYLDNAAEEQAALAQLCKQLLDDGVQAVGC